MVYGVLGIVEDITDRKAAEDGLGQLRKAVAQSANIVVITDVEGISEHVNRAFERSSGYTQEEILGRNTRILKSGMHPAEFYRDLWATIKSGRSWQGQFWWSRTTASPVSWPAK